MTRRSALTAHLEGFLPDSLAERYENAGAAKARSGVISALGVAVQTGAFVGLGAVLASVAVPLASGLPYGVAMLIAGLAFCTGVLPLTVLGADIFAADNLTAMALVSGKASLARVVRSLAVTLVGNLLGAAAITAALFAGLRGLFAVPAMAAGLLSTASAKCSLGFVQAISLGALCSVLVCLAVWACAGARSTADKVLVVIFPIAACVAAGFEHCVANVYYVPVALLIKWLDPALVGALAAAGPGINAASLTVGRFLLANLLPVALGNLVGGTGTVALVYWFLYLRPRGANGAAGGHTGR